MVKSSRGTSEELNQRAQKSSDNFDRDVSNPLLDIVDVAGDKDFTPERLRFFKDGSRVFLQYRTDSTFALSLWTLIRRARSNSTWRRVKAGVRSKRGKWENALVIAIGPHATCYGDRPARDCWDGGHFCLPLPNTVP